MPTPKEKSEELIQKFSGHNAADNGNQCWRLARSCALIAAREVAEQATMWTEEANSGIHAFWREVISELEIK